MMKTILKKGLAVLCAFAVTAATSTSICCNAAEQESMAGESKAAGIMPTNDDFILPPTENVYIEVYFDIDLPTGCGNGAFKVNLHSYDFSTATAYLPGITAGMGTTTTCDMGVYIWAVNQWTERVELKQAAYQSTAFHGKAVSRTLNTVWQEVECKEVWACDDVGNGTINYTSYKVNE